MSENKCQYMVTGMTCAACQAHVEKAVSKVPGVDSVTVSLLTNSMSVAGNAPAAAVVKAVEQAGYGAKPMGEASGRQSKLEAEKEALADHETPKLKRRLLLSLIFLAVLMYFTMGHNMLGLPVPYFLNHNHLGLALTEMILALLVMAVNRAFFISGFKSFPRQSQYGYPGGPGLLCILPLVSLCFLQNDLAHNGRGIEHGHYAPLPRPALL